MKRDPTVETGYYLKRRFSDPTDKERGIQPFYLKSIHNFYQKFSGSWSAGSAKLLEYGGGPCIYSLISAAPHFSEVTFSDYQQSNIDAVMAWRSGSEDHHDWTPYFKYVISELEENDSDDAVVQRQEDLRKKCRHFLRGDLHAKNILSSEDYSNNFDVVSSNFCCEPVANDISEYQTNVENLGKLVKPGGYFIGLVSLEESYWHTSYSDERFFHLYLTEEDVKKAYGDAGLDVIYKDVELLPESAQNILNDCKAIMFESVNL
jgi:SAM-dependent methyltransferase